MGAGPCSRAVIPLSFDFFFERPPQRPRAPIPIQKLTGDADPQQGHPVAMWKMLWSRGDEASESQAGRGCDIFLC